MQQGDVQQGLAHNFIYVGILICVACRSRPECKTCSREAAELLAGHITSILLVSSFVWPAGAILSARHAAERLQNCWHGGTQTIDQLRSSMQVSSD